MDSGDKSRWSPTGRWGGWRTGSEGLGSNLPYYPGGAKEEDSQAGREGS